MYGILFESKIESPIIHETKPMSYEDAYEKMISLRENHDVIRVCIFKLNFECGNQSLITKE